jgi:hypothetical protein
MVSRARLGPVERVYADTLEQLALAVMKLGSSYVVVRASQDG